MLKINLLFKKLETSLANNSRILRIKNAKFSGYCFYMNTNIYGDFQISVSVPLIRKPKFYIFNSMAVVFYLLFHILSFFRVIHNL